MLPLLRADASRCEFARSARKGRSGFSSLGACLPSVRGSGLHLHPQLSAYAEALVQAFRSPATESR